MNRYFVLLSFLWLAFSLTAQEKISQNFLTSTDLSWEKPELSGQAYQSILFEQKEEIFCENEFRDSTYFALKNFPTFKDALKKLFSEKTEGTRFYYRYKYFPTDSRNKSHATKMTVQLYCGSDYAKNDEESYFFPYYGLNVNGYLSKNLFYYADFWSGQYAGDLDFAREAALMNSWTQNSDDFQKIYLDNVRGKIQYFPFKFWSVSLGRGKYEIGNNIGGSIILSNNCVDYGYLSTKFDFDKFYVHFLHASLIADSTLTGNKDYPDKFLATHKFGWRPSDNWEIFWGEHVVYGSRTIDPSYLLPFTYWRGTEHNLADRDNVLIFSGANWKPQNYLLYLNFIFDELSFSKITENWWGNKYAIQTGISTKYSDSIRLTTEFTAVRPWIYTHKFLQNKFSNYGITLGFPQGSNLLKYALELNWKIRQNMALILHTAFLRQGSVGNNFSINYEERPSDTASWLEGKITDSANFTLVSDWQLLAHHRIRASMIFEIVDSEKVQNELMISYQMSY